MVERFKPKPINEWPDNHMQAATAFVERTAEVAGVKEVRAMSLGTEALLLFTRVKGRDKKSFDAVSGAEYHVIHEFPDVYLITIEAAASEPLHRTDLNDYLRKGIKPQVVFEKKVKGPRKQVEGGEWFFNEPANHTASDGKTFDKRPANPRISSRRPTDKPAPRVHYRGIDAPDQETLERLAGLDAIDRGAEGGIHIATPKEGRQIFEETVQRALGISTEEFLQGFKAGNYDYSHKRPDHPAITEALMTLPFIAGDLDEEALQMGHELLGWPDPKARKRQVERVKESLGTAEAAEDYKPFRGSPDVQDKS